MAVFKLFKVHTDALGCAATAAGGGGGAAAKILSPADFLKLLGVKHLAF